MSYAFDLRPEAALDIDLAAAWYDRQQPARGGDFLAAAEAALEQIERHPMRYPLQEGDARFALIEPFDYVAYFVVTPTVVEVFAVMHGRRDPSAWRRRLRQ